MEDILSQFTWKRRPKTPDFEYVDIALLRTARSCDRYYVRELDEDGDFIAPHMAMSPEEAIALTEKLRPELKMVPSSPEEA